MIETVGVNSDQVPRPLLTKKDLFFVALFLALFLVSFREFFFTSRVFYERDTTIVEIPARKLTVDLIRQGHFALWTDAYGNGQPFLANPKNAVIYPATLLYLILPLFTAFKLYYLIHVVLGWIGLYALGRSYSQSEKAAFLAASLFSFSGMYLSSFEFYNHIAALAWMPWILLLLNRAWHRRWAKLAVLAACWALLLLAGTPEIALLTLVFAAGQAFIVRGEWKRRFAETAVSLGLGCFLCAVQLLPSLELLTRSGREGRPADWPLELVQLVNVPFPHVLGNDREPGHSDYFGWHLFDKQFPLYYSLYMGIGALIAALAGLRRPLDRKRRVLLVLFGLLFLLACGSYSPFYVLHRALPILSSIRYPVKFFLGSVLCLCLLAGHGFDELSRRGSGKKFLRTLVLTTVIASALFWPLKSRILGLFNKLLVIDKPSSLAELGLSIATGLTLLAAYAALFVLMTRTGGRSRELGWALIALAVLDPAYHNRFVNPTVPPSFYDKPPLLEEFGPPLVVYRSEAYAPFLKQTLGDDLRLLGYFRKSLFPLTAMADGVKYVFDFDFYDTYPVSYSDRVDAVKKLPAESQLKILKFLGCRYYIGAYPVFSKETVRVLGVEGVRVAVERISEGPAAPYVVFSTIRSVSVDDKVRQFAEPGFNPYDGTILEKEIRFAEGPAGVDAGAARIMTKDQAQGFGRYEVDLLREGIAVFPGNYAPGWRAWIDDRPAEVMEANLFAKGVLVPSGSHEVVLRYLPRSFVWGAAISVATILVMLSWAGVSYARSKRTARPAAS